MKCEICHKADAAMVLHRKKPDGSEEELYVCKACAQAARPKRGKSGKNPETVVLNSGNGKPPPFVEDLLKATLGFVKGMAEEQDKAAGKLKDVCPSCGKKRDDFHEDDRLGCPDCWNAFASDLRHELAARHYGTRHIGGAPAAASTVDLCARLERMLKTAVRKQDFEKAEEIRRKLEELGGRPPRNSTPGEGK